MTSYKHGKRKTAIFRTLDIPVEEIKSYFLDQNFFNTQGCLLCFKASDINTFNNAINGKF